MLSSYVTGECAERVASIASRRRAATYRQGSRRSAYGVTRWTE